MALDFCLWLSAKNIITNKEELENNIVIEKAKEIEEEISSLNVDGASQKAIVNVRVNESEAKEKLDVDNGFLMCPNHDKIFDKGYITFDDDGKIIISEKLAEKENDMVFLNVDSRMHIELTEGNKKYLKFHRENIFNS
ncbi:MAG: hypothetical protein HFI13_05075 [Lachnospiraceae bacterium]|nr:hypothetical protein [Lachnospiraceae bacterium]